MATNSSTDLDKSTIRPLATKIHQDSENSETLAAQVRTAARSRWAAWNRLVSRRGILYEECRLENYEIDYPDQRPVVDQLVSYCDQLPEMITNGRGIVLFGSRGTGKDHLIMGVCRRMIGADYAVDWWNGLEIYGHSRDLISTHGLESEFIEDLGRAPILYISDPIPPVGKLTDFQAITLCRILDQRYSRRLPTLVTVNVSSGTELDDRMVGQNSDRIRDRSLALFCNWTSRRKPMNARTS